MKIKSNVFKFCVANDYPLVHFLCVKNMGFEKYPNCCGQGLSIHTTGDVWEEEGRPGGESGGGGRGPLALFTTLIMICEVKIIQ